MWFCLQRLVQNVKGFSDFRTARCPAAAGIRTSVIDVFDLVCIISMFTDCVCGKEGEREGGSQSRRPVGNNNVAAVGLWSAFWNTLLGGSLQLHIFWVNIN